MSVQGSWSKFLDIKNLLKSGESLFYITTTNEGISNTIYVGLFMTLDTGSGDEGSILDDVSNTPGESPRIIDDPNPSVKQETAIVTRRRISVSPK